MGRRGGWIFLNVSFSGGIVGNFLSGWKADKEGVYENMG
jgi:hypothetical protein